MILHIDTDLIEKYQLEMRELWVLTALKVLTCRVPWTGTYEQLAEKSMCGSRATAQRAVQVLKAKGLVLETKEGFVVPSQNETDSSQNETDSSQNETDSSQNETAPSQNETESSQNETELKRKRKEAKEKEKEVLNNVLNERESRERDARAREDFHDLDFPTWEELISHGQQQNYPRHQLDAFYAYYYARGWMMSNGVQMRNWKAALRSWIMRDKTPQLPTNRKTGGAAADQNEQRLREIAERQRAEQAERERRQAEHEALCNTPEERAANQAWLESKVK